MTDMTRDEAVKWLRDHVGDLRSAARVLRKSPWGAKLAATAAAVDKAADEGTLAIAALESAREDAWQLIETAPKDGTRVLLWIEWSDVPVVGEFSHDRWWADTEHYEVSCGAYCYGGSVSSDKDMKPTHWRPIPAPPAIDQVRWKGEP